MATTERIPTLDILRGVAVMGIVTMNIVSFAMPQAAYANPRAYGGNTGLDLAVYLVNFLFFDGKMRGLFSLLFGASMLLVVDRAERKGESAVRVHFARMVWLLVFGLAHLWLLWRGDILSHYALIGCIAYCFRDLAPARLVRIGIISLLLGWLLTAGLPLGLHQAQLAAAGTGEMAVQAQSQIAALRRGLGTPSPDWIAGQLALFRGGYGPILFDRIGDHFATPVRTAAFVGPETLAYMLFGMAGLKSGMLTGAWSRRRYRIWLGVGFGIGIPAYAAIGAYLVAADFSLASVALGVTALTVPLRPPMILAWAALIILALRPGGLLATRVAAAGRMAFTNYLGTSLICTTVFYGYGLGWYGYLSRAELCLPVLALWAAMLAWSKPWLDHFRYGPLEWLWRSLARCRVQPMRNPVRPARENFSATNMQ